MKPAAILFLTLVLAIAAVVGTTFAPSGAPVGNPALAPGGASVGGLEAAQVVAATVTSDPSAPIHPRSKVDVSEPEAGTGRTIHVPAGESVQSAIDAAQPGDRITLEAGAAYEGPIRLSKKAGDGWIVIASNQLAALPAGRRVHPSDARHMAKLSAASKSVFIAEAGAHHYRLAGLEIAPAAGTFVYNLIEFGADDSNLTDVPHHIVIDRSYLHGDPKRGARRGVAMNGREIAVINSYLADFKEVGADSQAISGWNGPGPFRIENNYLEAAGENVMFGGADPAVNGLVPSDIEVTRNHFSKPLSWKADDPLYAGTAWSVKNLFELKNARRVLVEGNLFEHNWPHAQNGFAILFTPRNQDGRAPWSVVEDVVFRRNVVRRVAAGFNILGRDDIHESGQTRRIAIHDNLLTEVGGKWGGNGRLFQLLNGAADVSVVGNTAEHTTGGIAFGGDHDPHSGFVFRNNVMPDNGSGFIGSGTAPGRASLDRFFPDADIQGNVFVGGKPAQYPPGNYFRREEAPAAGADTRALSRVVDEVLP